MYSSASDFYCDLYFLFVLKLLCVLLNTTLLNLFSVAEVGFVRLGITEIFLCIDFDLEYGISNISEIKYAVPKNQDLCIGQYGKL